MSQESSQVSYQRGNVRIAGKSPKAIRLMYFDLIGHYGLRFGFIIVTLCIGNKTGVTGLILSSLSLIPVIFLNSYAKPGDRE